MRGEVADKKDMSVETTAIDPLSLVFASSALEKQWRHRNLPRQKDISIRYFAAATLFQLLFLWADAIERQPSVWVTVARICMAVLSATVALLVGLSLLTPRPHILFWVNLAYGVPTLILHSLQKPELSHWDSLFLVYGLCFMTLPQVTPLNFFFGSVGSVLFILLYVSASAMRLELDQWVLSSVLLVVVSALFCYIAYCSEKGARERWLLRQRLSKEHISIELRPQRVEDSIERGAMVFDVSALLNVLSQYASAAPPRHHQNGPSSRPSVPPSPSSSNTPTSRFLKGMLAWLLCTVVGYLADYLQYPQFQDAQLSGSFALFVHTVGFSMFLVVTTGQIRWVVVNGVMGLVVLWVFTQVVPSRSMTFWAHMFGYLLLACVVVTVIAVFGGVVLVWSHLLDYIRDILLRYPQVQGDVKASKLLEQVLIRHVASLKDSKVLTRTLSDPQLTLLELTGSNEDEAVQCCVDVRLESAAQDVTSSPPGATRSLQQQANHGRAPSQENNLLPVLHGRKPQACYFCLCADAKFLIPACGAWHCSGKTGEMVPMCTPYASVMQKRDALQAELKAQAERLQASQAILAQEEQEHAVTCKKVAELQRRLLAKDQQAVEAAQKHRQLLRQERQRRDEDVGKLLQTLNKSVGKIKQLQKALSKREQPADEADDLQFPPPAAAPPPQQPPRQPVRAQPPPLAQRAAPAPAPAPAPAVQLAAAAGDAAGGVAAAPTLPEQEAKADELYVEPALAAPAVGIANWDPSKIDDEFWLQPLDTIEELFAHTFRPVQPTHPSRRMRYTLDMGLGGADGAGSG